eukprot:scaffold275792_cov28-Tisochrysis_lutea.AAC.2
MKLSAFRSFLYRLPVWQSPRFSPFPLCWAGFRAGGRVAPPPAIDCVYGMTVHPCRIPALQAITSP